MPTPNLQGLEPIAIFGISIGGEGEIRTHESLSTLPVFKTGAIDHSATSPEDKRTK